MSDAIEVLNNYWKYVHSKDTLDFDSEFHNAINEALLALEWKSNIEKEFVALGINTKKIEGKGIIHIASDYVNTERKLFDLKSWLEKEIVAGRIKQSRAQTQGENVRQTISMTRLKALREVLGFLELGGEQK